MRSLNRREFLTLGASAFLLSQCRRGDSQGLIGSEQTLPTISSQKIYRSTNGTLSLDLEASYRPIQIGSQRMNLMAYNGQIPGPRMEVKPGDTVRIQFQNNLPDPTNLHFHGLHIPPTGNADNVFRSVARGETVSYEFSIPNPHPGGLAYYHPHLHGYVADQILGGLGGMIVVRGALDDIPDIQAAQETLLFLKDFMIDERQWMMGLMAGREGDLITVNGTVQPSFSMPAGGLIRLRLVNGSNAKFYRLALEKHPLFLIATDGYPLAAPLELSELLLSPGERADVLVQATQEPGSYQLLNLPYDRGGMGMMGRGMRGGGMRGRMGRERMGRGMMGRHRMGESFQSGPQTLATFSYQGQVEARSLPTQLIPIESLPAPTTERQFTLNHGMRPGQGMAFLINGKSFNPKRIDTKVALNTVEDWEIINTGVMDHPFHLHTNAFQVIARNGRPVTNPQWKDTILVPTGETVRIRIPFKDYAGKTVYHCHILDHEELGMMGIIDMQFANG